MTDLKDFFSRWSRRKRGATESSTAKDRVDVERVAAQVGLDRGESGTLGAPPLPIGERAGVRGDRLNERPQPLTPPLSQWEREQTEAADPLPGQTQSPGEVAFDLTQLPSIESITAESDISAFLAPGVPAELTRAALRRAWAVDPKIRDFVGLSENSWDFNAAGAIPGFGPLEMTDELRRHIAQLLNRDLRESSSPQSSPAAEAQEDRAAVEVSPPAPSTAIPSARTDLQPVGGAERSPPATANTKLANSGEPDQRPSEAARRLHGRALPE